MPSEELKPHSQSCEEISVGRMHRWYEFPVAPLQPLKSYCAKCIHHTDGCTLHNNSSRVAGAQREIHTIYACALQRFPHSFGNVASILQRACFTEHLELCGIQFGALTIL